MSSETLRIRLGLRRRISILPPAALLLLMVVSTFTLFSYRRAVADQVELRRAEAVTLARRLAESVGGEARSPADEARRALPAGAAAVLLDAAGRRTRLAGPPTAALAPLALPDPPPEEPVVEGPGRPTSDRVVVLMPVGGEGQRAYLQLEVPAGTLGGQRRAVEVLTWVVLPANLAVALLLITTVRQLLQPYERLLAKARELGPADRQDEDEGSYLIATFERALEALRREPGPPPDDIAALERTLGPSLESGLLLLDRRARLLALNSFGARLLGIEPGAPGVPLEEVLAPHAQLLAIVRAAVGERRGAPRQEARIVVGGERRTLGLTVHPLRRDDGSFRGSLVLFADLTEIRRRAEEERLSESLAQVGELAAGLAHELRNSLATLRGYLTLVDRAPDEESIADYLTEIRRESDHLQRVLEDFLSFARPETTRMEEIDLGAVVRRAARDPALAGVEVRVEEETAADEPTPATLKGDDQLLERAIRNLLHNAAEAQTAAGVDDPLRARLFRDGGDLVLEIDDRGPGIPEEIRDRVFQPFTTASGGTGLGLALARRIVDLHGGGLTLDDRPGGGTRATLRFEEASRSGTAGSPRDPAA